jgi:methionyl-tRNA formyltransferase
MGTPEFAVPSLTALVEGGYNVVGVVTMPDKPAGRGMKLQESDVKRAAKELGISTILQPEKLRDEEFLEALRALQPDLGIVIAFRMLPEVVWAMPRFGTFNLHASLLPEYRGAAPINHAIINGEKETGLTTFLLDKEIDTGEIIMQEKVVIEDDETAGTLHDKLMVLGNKVVVETIKRIEEGRVQSQSQDMIIERDNLQLKPAPKIFKEDCKIDWTKDAKSIYDFIRGLSPYPAAHTQFVSENNETLDIKVFEVALKENKSEDTDLYKIKTDGKSYLDVVLGKNNISIKVIQQAGKKAMPIADFLRGTRLEGEWMVK